MSSTKTITSRAFVLTRPNIDTDQIIPARFLSTTGRAGLGAHAFANWRTGENGRPNEDCPLNDTDKAGASIIVAGHNFGCGSSREHAVWALHDLGIRAVISTEIADIFTSNALKNGIAPLEVAPDDHAWFCECAADSITIDLEDQTIDCAGRRCTFTIDPFGRRCLVDGVDALGAIINHADAIARYEETNRCTR